MTKEEFERAVLIVTATGTVFAALAAVFTLPLTSCHNARSLAASNAATAQAQEEHRAQIEQSARDRKVMMGFLEVANQDRLKNAEQFQKQLKLAEESAVRQVKALQDAAAEQKQQSDAALAEQRRMWEEEKLERRKLRYEELSPRMTPRDCCSYQVAIMLLEPSPLVPAHVQLPLSAIQKQEFPAHYNIGFVTKLVNLGGGPAEKLQVDWIVSEIQRRTKAGIQTETIDDLNQWRHTMTDTYPAYVRAGDETEIRSVPRCIAFDKDEEIVFVAGNIVFQYFHVLDPDDRPTQMMCDFWMQPTYKVENRDGIPAAPPAIHVHIGDLKRVEPVNEVAGPTYAPTEVLPTPDTKNLVPAALPLE